MQLSCSYHMIFLRSRFDFHNSEEKDANIEKIVGVKRHDFRYSAVTSSYLFSIIVPL